MPTLVSQRRLALTNLILPSEEYDYELKQRDMKAKARTTVLWYIHEYKKEVKNVIFLIIIFAR